MALDDRGMPTEWNRADISWEIPEELLVVPPVMHTIISAYDIFDGANWAGRFAGEEKNNPSFENSDNTNNRNRRAIL